MRLSEINVTDNMKVLIYGNSGTGKTCAAASFPTPILYLDFDGKVDSAASFYSHDPERLKQIEVRDLSSRMEEDPIEELLKIIDKELIPQQKTKKMEYKTLVVDSLTTFSSAVLNHIVRTNPGIKTTAGYARLWDIKAGTDETYPGNPLASNEYHNACTY